MNPKIEIVTRYKCSDDREFSRPEWAEEWQQNIDTAEKANALLYAGGSVADALRLFGQQEVPEVFERVTKDSKLVITHWQYSEKPGYKVICMLPDRCFYVGGNVGSWSGAYGDNVTPQDLERYAEDERSILKPEPETAQP